MLLDIGLGILAALGLSPVFEITNITAWVFAGIIFSLLPDIDALIHIYRHGRGTDHKHRDITHLPLLYIPIGFCILLPFSIPGAFLFAVCSLAHFVHDSIGIGWGVQWLYPLNTDHFSFLYIYKPLDKPRLPKQLVYRWKHEDIDALDAAHGDQNWLHNIYVRMHPYAMVELAVLCVALTALYIYAL